MSPLVPITLVAATLTALVVALKGKKSSGGTPIPEPQDVAPIYMQGAAGSRQFVLKRVGPGYAWDVRGDKEGTGSDSVSGTAIMDMLEFAYTGNDADKVTASIAKGSDEGLAGSFSIAKVENMKWDWIVSKPTPEQASALGSGESTNRGAATIAALKAVEPYTDWIVGLPSVQGESTGEPPAPGEPPGPGEEPVIQRDGIVISSTTVTAYDLPMWLDYAAPIVAVGIQNGHGVEQIHQSLGLHGLPNTVKFTGKTHGQVLNTMKAYLDQWNDEKFLELENIQRTIAAAAIGAKISIKGKKGYVKKKPIVVREVAFRRFEWFVWAPGNRRGDQYAIFHGESLILDKAWNQAVEAATGPGTMPAGEGPPIMDCDETTKTSSLSRNLPVSTFLDSWTKEIKLWAPSDADECQMYRLVIGVCMTPNGGGSFGKLDYYTEGTGEGDALTKGDAEEITFGLARHPAYAAPMDWFLFKPQLAWKRQIQIELSYVDGTLEIMNTMPVDNPGVDPCPERIRRWPGLGDDHYVVQAWKKPTGWNGAWNGAPRREFQDYNWTSQPKFELFIDNNKLFASIGYKGLPYFEHDTEPLMKMMAANPLKKNGYTVGFKIQSKGIQ